MSQNQRPGSKIYMCEPLLLKNVIYDLIVEALECFIIFYLQESRQCGTERSDQTWQKILLYQEYL